MFDKVFHSHTRFNVNMARIAGLMSLALSGDRQSFMQYGDVSADIFRFIVVFLHATAEDLVRSQLPGNTTFSFGSGRDIDKAFKRAGFDSSPLKPLYPPLFRPSPCQYLKSSERSIKRGENSRNALNFVKTFLAAPRCPCTCADKEKGPDE
jgi:hypothetical protein